MLDLNQHNELRVQMLRTNPAPGADVECPACRVEMVVAGAVVLQAPRSVPVKCPRCGLTGTKVL